MPRKVWVFIWCVSSWGQWKGEKKKEHSQDMQIEVSGGWNAKRYGFQREFQWEWMQNEEQQSKEHYVVFTIYFIELSARWNDKWEGVCWVFGLHISFSFKLRNTSFNTILYQRPGSLRFLRSILAVRRTALFWTEISDVIHGICWSHSPSSGVTAPSALIRTGTTASIPTSFQFPYSALSIFQAYCVPSSWCCCHMKLLHLSLMLSSVVCQPPQCPIGQPSLAYLNMEVPQDLTTVMLDDLWRCFQFWLWDFQVILGTDVPVHYSCQLVMALHVCCTCLHLTPRY